MTEKKWDIRSNDPRVIMPPHYADMLGRNVLMFPSLQMLVSSLVWTDGTQRIAIRMATLNGNSALQFLPTAEELRALGEEMIEQADIMEKRADDEARAAIERAMRHGG